MYGKDNFTWFLGEKMETITVAHQKFGEEKKKEEKNANQNQTLSNQFLVKQKLKNIHGL